MMLTPTKTKLMVGCSCLFSVILMAGCGKATGKTTQNAATAPSKAASAPALASERPKLPDPNRTDPEAVAQRKALVDWQYAADIKASESALKAQAEFLGADKPAPSGNYGRMADGLTALPASKK